MLLRGGESEGGKRVHTVGGGLCGEGWEQIWRGAQADLERLLLTEGGASAGATGKMPKVFRTSKEARRAGID